MKKLIAIIFAVAVVGFFVEESNAQCYGGRGGVTVGYYGGGGYYGGHRGYARPAVGVYYNSGPVYRHARPVYYGHPRGGHYHGGYRGVYPGYGPRYGGYYGGGGGVYYRGPSVGIGVRF